MYSDQLLGAACYIRLYLITIRGTLSEQALTLVGPSDTSPVIDPLAVLRLDNLLNILVAANPKTKIQKNKFIFLTYMLDLLF